MKISKADREEARVSLGKILSPGDTVFTVLRGVSRSGMSRHIDCYKIVDGEPRWLSRYMARAGVAAFDEKRECLRVNGCGEDKGFSIVYSLSRTLFPKGFAVEGTGRNGDTSGWDTDGGYALKQRWL